jgi:azobenzene reductase
MIKFLEYFQQMKTQIISGSHRLNSQSLKVAKFIQKMIQTKGGEAKITDLAHGSLPLWDERVWEGNADFKKVWDPIASDLRAADSLVVISPEYSGMAAPALKNFFLFCGGDLIAHKPTLLVAVTSSLTNGAYPIQELRGSGHKNSKQLYIPDHVIIREAEKVLNDENANGPSDEFFRTRLAYSLSTLAEYENALKQVRASGVIKHKEFPFGM